MRVEPLQALLADATARGRPAVALSPRGLAELVGGEPDAGWLRAHTPDGWQVEVASAAVTFTPTPDAPAGPAPTDVRVQVRWSRPDRVRPGPGLERTEAGVAETDRVEDATGEVAVTAVLTSSDATAELDLADDEVRALALQLERTWRRLRDLNPGWG